MEATKVQLPQCFTLVFLALPWFLTGCTSLGQQANQDLTATVTPAADLTANPQTSAEAKYAVEFHYDEDRKQPESMERPFSGTLHAQEALEQSGALKKFRRCEISLVRRLPNGMGHQIPLEYDRVTRRVNPEFDYALLPGDRLLVTEDVSTIIDDMMQNSWLAPLTNMGGAKKGRTTSGGHFRMAKSR